ncbi:indolepyruvate ferredoxin oxidoreductase subunit alpha [bacterium]
MAYTIDSSLCTNCGACDPTCPVEAISEQDGKRVIEPDTCIDCASCVPACPVEAIKAP